ncbi:MAG: hypothetical protein LQ352_007097 [Teloschistes flavicans]|nr:MAG: hypothetical protein LQ352_007097 [Teloschistes flavicans]
MPKNKGQVVCFTATCSRSFKDVSAILSHLESGGCPSGLTVQDLNHLICQVPTATSIIIPGQEPWFRAGPPRNEVRDIYDFDQVLQQWRCPYCPAISHTKDPLARHLREKVCSSTYPNTLQCPTCQKGFVKLSELFAHSKCRMCKAQSGKRLVRAGSNDIFSPIVRYLEGWLACWRPLDNEGPRIEYQLRWDGAESPRMMVQVMEILPGQAASGNINGRSSGSASPDNDNAMLENNVAASPPGNEPDVFIDSNETNHPSSNHTSPSQAYKDRHFELNSSLRILNGSPEGNLQQESPSWQKQADSQEMSEEKTLIDFPSTSSNISFPQIPKDALEWSEQQGEPLSVPMIINRRLEAARYGAEVEDPSYSRNAAGGIDRQRLSNQTANSGSRENLFQKQLNRRSNGGSPHRGRRHESKQITSQEQESSESRNENEPEGSSIDDDESGGVPLT